MTRKQAEAAFVKELTETRKFHDAHQRDLRSKNKRARARAQDFERVMRRLDADITELLAAPSKPPTSR